MRIMENNEQEKSTISNTQVADSTSTTQTNNAVANNNNATAEISSLSRAELVTFINNKLTSKNVANQTKIIEEAKKQFDTLTEQIVNQKREEYKAEHEGTDEGFVPDSDDADIDMQTTYSEYKKQLATEQNANSKQKRAIIEQMEQLLQGNDVSQYNKQFRELLEQWRTIGHVQATEAHELNAKQKRLTDQFFENLKLNHDMRELDQKRNYEAKIKLCEQAEELAQMQSATKSFNQIQSLHAQWKQIGAVPFEVRDELWERFKKATTTINNRFHKYLDESKEREKANYEAKLALIAQVEEIQKEDLTTRKAIDLAINKIEELQQKWRTIGIVPKAVNAEVYSTFRKACDQIYSIRRAFHKQQNEVFKQNLELKKRLIEKAEALKDSTDWKATFDKFVAIQKEWKKIGPVPHNVANSTWEKFKTTCDYFFEQREKALGYQDSERENNYIQKKQILDELKAAQLPTDSDELFKTLQEYQQRWNSVGQLPSKKHEIQQEFANIINKLYDQCATEDASKNLQRFKAKMEMLNQSADGQQKIEQERNKLISKIKQLEADANTLDNNIGFFSKSKQSDKLIANFENKIKTVRQNIEQINEKLDIIDSL